jgi:hypothetical protein
MARITPEHSVGSVGPASSGVARQVMPNSLMMTPASAAIAAARRAMRRNVFAAGMPRCCPRRVHLSLPLNKP